MSPETKSRVLGSIAQAWPDDPTVQSLCIAIVDFLETPPRKEYLTYGMLKRATGLQPAEAQREFAAAIQYLLGDTAPVLELGFEIIDVDGTPTRITTDEALAAAKEGIHPLTGAAQDNIRDLIITYFRPSGVWDD
jgi:hypothetical protein